MNWWKPLKGRVRINEPLKRHTTFKIGGRASFFIEPADIEDLKVLLILLKRCKIPFLLIGSGSNLLVADKGLKAAVVALTSPYFKKARFRGNSLEVSSGVKLNQIVRLAEGQGLSGLEFLSGIPGTVGGALAMNAGVSEKVTSHKSGITSIGGIVENVTVMDYNGRIKVLDRKDIEFGYRESSLAKYIILAVRLKLVKKNKKEIRDNIKRYLDYRKGTQGANWLSAGCVFKNPQEESAGRLIDLCGLKGRRFGGAVVSLQHANFILNSGNAKSGDILKLMDLIKAKVKNKFGITLKPEIKIWQ